MSILLKYKKQRNEEFNKFIEPAIDKGFDGGSVDIQALQRQRIAWREEIKHFHNETIDGAFELIEQWILNNVDTTGTAEEQDVINQIVNFLSLKQSKLKESECKHPVEEIMVRHRGTEKKITPKEALDRTMKQIGRAVKRLGEI